MRARGAGVWVAALALACGFGEPDDDTWVASVDDHAISLGDLRSGVEARLRDNPEADRDELLNEELTRLVSERVVLNRAARIGIDVLDEDIARRLGTLHGSEFSDPDPEYREQIRRQMTIDRTALFELRGKIRVPESAMVLHFEEHRDQYRLPERIAIRQIVVEERVKADELRAQLDDETDFAALASEHSLAPEASEGGQLPPFARGEMPEVFDRAFDLKVGEVSKVVESPYGFHLFLLEERHDPHEPEYAEVRERIQLEMESERLEDLRRDWLRGLRRAASIEVNDSLLEELR